MKRRGAGADESVESLSAKLDAEIARRKDLSLKVAEKEALVEKMTDEVEAEEVALAAEAEEKKAELEALREAIEKAAALLERRKLDSVRIAAQAAGVDKELAALKAQMASRFVTAVSGGLELTESEMAELPPPPGTRHTVGADAGPTGTPSNGGREGDEHRQAVLKESAAWSMVDLYSGFDLRAHDQLAADIVDDVRQRLVAPMRLPDPPAPPATQQGRGGRQANAAGSPPKSSSKPGSMVLGTAVSTATLLGRSDELAASSLEAVIEKFFTSLKHEVIDRHCATDSRISFAELADSDTPWPAIRD